MTINFTPLEDAALRAVKPPPLSTDFADRLLARLDETRPTPSKPFLRTGDRRGAWRRSTIILMTSAAAGLLSFGAAASGLLGKTIQSLPVVSYIAETVAPAAKPKPAPKVQIAKAAPAKPVAVLKPAAVSPPPVIALPANPQSDPSLLPPEVRRQARAERILHRLEARAERRRAQGLPPRRLPPEARQRLRTQLEAMPPEERRALRERLRAMREQRRMERRAETIQPRPNNENRKSVIEFEPLTERVSTERRRLGKALWRRRQEVLRQMEQSSPEGPPPQVEIP